MPADPATLLERERELRALDRLLDAAVAGRGGVALIEGPAGIGKSRLLAAVRERAAERVTVLAARCGELERDFAFGAVRQLLEPAVRADPALLSGAAAPAAGVLGAPEAGDGEGSFAALHGLYWAVLDLAERHPVLLAVDDLQWADRPSLRFLAYLARRLEGTPVLLAATVRSTDPGTDPGLLAEIAGDPLSEAVRPGPLGEASVRELVRARLGEDPDPAFASALAQATGGNPLLVGRLLTALEDDGVRPTAEGAAALQDIGPRAVLRTVLLRLARLPAEAIAVARAVAVLGESAALPAVAALAGLPEPEVARAAGELARADLLRPEPPLGFVHPLVHEAVLRELPPGERELQHARAAEVLGELHAGAEAVAGQLLHAPRRGEVSTVALLREAAASATRRGGPDSAVAYLARALAEPPPEAERARVLFELGVAESEMNAPLAADHLRAALDAGLAEPAERATAAFALAQALMFTGRAAEAGALARATLTELPTGHEDERAMVEAMAAFCVYFGDTDRSALALLDRHRGGPVHNGPGARMAAAAAAFALAVGGGPAAAHEQLALAALAPGDLLARGGGLVWSAAIIALVLADSPRTADALEAARAESHRTGSVLGMASIEMFTGLWQLHCGELEDAGPTLVVARQLQEPWGSDRIGNSWARGMQALHALATGDAALAREQLGPPPAPEDESDGANLCRWADAELLLADGRAGEALAVAELMAATAPHVRHPAWKPAGSLRARALARLGRRDEAVAAMDEELALARGSGAPFAVGRALRLRAELEDDPLALLDEAVAVLAGSPARLERAQALVARGAALRRARRPADAREPLRQALELAEACGATPLAEAARTELRAAGVRPRTTAVTGVAALTASEARVAALAAEGRTNREIAQALFVTPKTVELHLSSAYRKLDIRSRRDLPAALAPA